MDARLAVFASGGGSNLQALLDRFGGGRQGVGLVISDRPEAFALERARRGGATPLVIPVSGRTPEHVVEETLAALEEAAVDIVCLAGYLRLVPAPVVRRYAGRMLNIHPALLPAFGGKGMHGRHVHRAVLEAGCRVSGATVHLVDEEYDRGRIVMQWPVPVLDGDTPETLAARILPVEHRIYPAAVETLLRGDVAGDLPEPQQTSGAIAFTLGDLEAPDPAMVERLLPRIPQRFA